MTKAELVKENEKLELDKHVLLQELAVKEGKLAAIRAIMGS